MSGARSSRERNPARNPSLPKHLHFDVREFVIQLEALLDVLQGLALMLEDLYDGTWEALAEAQYE